MCGKDVMCDLSLTPVLALLLPVQLARSTTPVIQRIQRLEITRRRALPIMRKEGTMWFALSRRGEAPLTVDRSPFRRVGAMQQPGTNFEYYVDPILQ